MEEIYKPIKQFNGEYEISNFGNCRSTKKIIIKSNGKTYTRESKVLKPAKSQDGYLKCAVSFNGKLITKPIHRLVAETFINKPDTYLEVNHIDGNKTNNNVNNLEWITKSENLKHAYKLNLLKAKKGELNGNSKLTWCQVEEIRALALITKSGRYYNRKGIAEKYGISEAHVKDIVNKRRNIWSHV
jgi:mannosyltransferase OCH1-like enzyme